MRRQLIWLAVIVLAAGMLVGALRYLQVSRSNAVDANSLAGGADGLPFDIGSRAIPVPGADTLVLAAEVGAVSQLTVDGQTDELAPYCGSLDPAAAFAICENSVMPQAAYVRLSRYVYDDDTEVTLVAGYFDEIEAAQVISEADIERQATQAAFGATALAEVALERQSTAAAVATGVASTQTAVVEVATQNANPDSQAEFDGLMASLDTTAVAAVTEVAVFAVPQGTPIAAPTVPAQIAPEMNAVEAISGLLNQVSNEHQVGYFSLLPEAESGYYYAQMGSVFVFTWRNGDWVYQASTRNPPALDFFVETFPY